MTQQEQEYVMDKALRYANKRVSELPDYLKANCIIDAIYCAYLEGAGIKTK